MFEKVSQSLKLIKNMFWSINIYTYIYILESVVALFDGDVSDANTKVYEDGHIPFKHFFLGMFKAINNIEAAMKKQIR